MSKKTQDPPIKKNAFVHKLYSMLNDPKLAHLIWWTENSESNTFALYPGKEFAYALTGYFKHGNVASFIRQLHMYGFHKVSDPNQSSASSDKDNTPVWEFKHSSGKFKKDDESSLIYIKRRSSSNSSRNSYNSSEHSPHPHQTDNMLIPTSSPSPNSFEHHQQYYQQQYVPVYYHPINHQLASHVPAPPASPVPHITHPHLNRSNIQVQYQPHIYSYTSTTIDQQQQHYPISQHNAHIQQLQPQQTQSNIHQPPHHSKPQHTSPLQQSNSPKNPIRQSSFDDSHSVRHNSDYPRSKTPQASVHPQHYTANLQFRKIWENNANTQTSRPRNPSLLFDPLAPAPIQSTPPMMQPSLPTSAHQPYPGNNTNSIISTKDPFLHVTSNKDSIDSRSSIKLPPPSIIHRTSNANFNYPNSPDLNENRLPRSIPSTYDYSPSQMKSNSSSNSITGSPSNKKPSLVPINNSIHERLRPSLIEMYLGSNRNSLSKPHNDSIGSHATSNSIFSNKSSLSSFSSFKRTSSFGSISHNSIIESTGKKSISIGPHDLTPNYEQYQFPRSSSPSYSKPDLIRSLTPPNLPSKLNLKPIQIHSPISRSASSFQGSSNPTPPTIHSLGSLNNTPLSRSGLNEVSTSTSTATSTATETINKVTVNSLLDDTTSEKNCSGINSSMNDNNKNSSDEVIDKEDVKRQRLI